MLTGDVCCDIEQVSRRVRAKSTLVGGELKRRSTTIKSSKNLAVAMPFSLTPSDVIVVWQLVKMASEGSIEGGRDVRGGASGFEADRVVAYSVNRRFDKFGLSGTSRKKRGKWGF
ncbi:hypothetical protein PanWU01x14_287970 [Parasponia andersonii]|uniref:Uncharacterized protein n=1 Tax=Parasponia andersonii TaxID=3476 RepID=A0A2P5AYJ3_PARAD|nr:hypothetical protein PanWU01x14_287970 [Parasponia andersonii]